MTKGIRLVVNSDLIEQITIESKTLAIKLLNKPIKRFAITKLINIQLIGDYQKTIAPLLYCVKQGIYVSFMSQRGKLLGLLSSEPDNNISLNQWLENCHFDPFFKAYYEQWKNDQTRHLLGQLNAKGNIKKMKRQVSMEVNRQLSLDYSHSQKLEIKQWLRGVVQLELSQVLTSNGLNPVGMNMALLQKDLAGILTIFSIAHYIDWLKTNNQNKLVNALEISKFQNKYCETLTFQIEKMVRQLCFKLECIS